MKSFYGDFKETIKDKEENISKSDYSQVRELEMTQNQENL